jgi:hypothetical protein
LMLWRTDCPLSFDKKSQAKSLAFLFPYFACELRWSTRKFDAPTA